MYNFISLGFRNKPKAARVLCIHDTHKRRSPEFESSSFDSRAHTLFHYIMPLIQPENMIREDKYDTYIKHKLSESFAKCFACITTFHFQNDYRVGPIIFILLMSKLRLRDVKHLSPNYTAGR